MERSEESLICLVLSSLRLFLRESRVWCADERRVRRMVISTLWERLGLAGCDMFFFWGVFLFGTGVSGRKHCNKSEVSRLYSYRGFEILWLETDGYMCKRGREDGYVGEYISTYLLTHLTQKNEKRKCSVIVHGLKILLC